MPKANKSLIAKLIKTQTRPVSKELVEAEFLTAVAELFRKGDVMTETEQEDWLQLRKESKHAHEALNASSQPEDE